MKIALCLYGMAPMDCLKHASHFIKQDITRNHWLKYIIEPNNMDVFIHCWSPKYQDEYLNDYKPKDYLFEQEKKWPCRKGFERIIDYNNSLDEIMQSVHYSLKQSVDMKTKYEIKNNFKYDFVMIARMDIVWFKEQKIENYNLDKSYIYTSPWNYAFDIHKNMDTPYIFDHYMITGTDMANTISNIFYSIDKYVQYGTPQVIKYFYFQDINIIDKIKPLFYRFHDHILFRWLYYPEKYLFRKGKPLTDEWEGLLEQRENLLKQILDY